MFSVMVNVANDVEPEDSESHVNNDNKTSAFHQTEGVNQAVVFQAGDVEEGGVGGDVVGGCGERVVLQGGHDGRN